MRKYFFIVGVIILMAFHFSSIPLLGQNMSKIIDANLIPVINTHNFAEEFYVDIKVEGITNLFGISFQLNFPSQYLSAISSERGDILGTQIIYYDNIDNTNGTVSIGVTKTGIQGGFTGSGIVAKIKFQEKSTALSGTVIDFSISGISANDPSGASINITPVNSSYTVGGSNPYIYPFVNFHSLHEEYDLLINVENVQNLFGVSFKLMFPYDKLEVLSTQKGDFLGSNVIYYDNINNDNGEVSIGMSKTGSQPGSNGSGTIAMIKVKEKNSVTPGTEISLALSEIAANDNAGNAISLTGRDTSYVMTSVETKDLQAPASFKLLQNYPNPFNPETTIEFSLPETGRARIDILNELGEKVKTLIDQKMFSGNHSVVWNGKNESGMQVVSGNYYYRLKLNNKTICKKMILIR